MSFLDLVTDLLADPAAKQAYSADPQGWLDDRGFGDLTPTELDRALGHTSDVLAPDVAAALGPEPTLGDAASLDLASAGLTLERPAMDDVAPPEIDDDPYASDVGLDLDTSEDEDAASADAGAASDHEGADIDDLHDFGDSTDDVPTATDDADIVGTTSGEDQWFDDTDGAPGAADAFAADNDFDYDDTDVDDPFDGLD